MWIWKGPYNLRVTTSQFFSLYLTGLCAAHQSPHTIGMGLVYLGSPYTDLRAKSWCCRGLRCDSTRGWLQWSWCMRGSQLRKSVWAFLLRPNQERIWKPCLFAQPDQTSWILIINTPSLLIGCSGGDFILSLKFSKM